MMSFFVVLFMLQFSVLKAQWYRVDKHVDKGWRESFFKL